MNTKIILAMLLLIALNSVLCEAQNIGIGIDNPTEKLEVDGGVYCDSIFISGSLSNILGSVIARYDPNDNKIFLADDNISLTSAGKMGIGTAGPNFQIHVDGSIRSQTLYIDESLKGPTLNGVRSTFAEVDPITDTVYMLDGNLKYYDDEILTITSDLIVKDRMHIGGSLQVGLDGSEIFKMKTIVVQTAFDPLPGQTEVSYYRNVSNVPKGSAISISLVSGDLPGAIVFGQAYMEADNVVRLKLINMGSNTQTLGTQTLAITVIN